MTTSGDVPHPGKRIRAEVIPPGMSVTTAAKVVGVGRPALSNLLNGNAALSVDMATRLEKAFSYPRKDLLDMQARYDAARALQKSAPAGTKAYVPPFLVIKANDVERWVTHNVSARRRLAVFLRTLVHSTGIGLKKVDFPGNDDAERAGWDGYIETGEGTPWIPSGRSGWEFGTNEHCKTKADGDFEKSVKALDQKARDEITFVFVTPRRWPGKAAWAAAAKMKAFWKDVRAYDASDLEQWLEQSLPGQAWFANETHFPAQDVRSLDKCWADWADVSAPPLTGALFNSAIDAAKRVMLSYLSKPADGPILIAADSTEEAVAFLAQLLSDRGGPELAACRDRVIVFDRPGVLPRLAEGAQTFIPVVFTRDVERELAPYARALHSIVVYPRNATSTAPQIILEVTSFETFNGALEEMGKGRDEISRLASASGRSLTVLRRQLSTVHAVKIPAWAADHRTAASIVPFLFVGAWNSQNQADVSALSLLAGDRPYEELEKACQGLARLNDCPVWSIGTMRGVISKIDLLYAIAGAVTPNDLKRFFLMAGMVLGEDDPALDLEDRQRWAASFHGKTREFSGAFREGISETLVLLAVHGERLFKMRLGVDTEIESARLVRDLLPTPLTPRILEANNRDLPTYAEAAPDEFLSIIEHDLKTDHPAVLELLRPAEPDIFGGTPSRTGLLWALEGLAWNPVTLPRAALILARLAEVQIDDNWANKPANSLESIFRAWMPQTAASLEVRIDLMKKLAQRFPYIAWRICVAQFGVNHQVGSYSQKPRWRSDGFGFGEPLSTSEPIIAFMREMVEMALSWKGHSLGALCDLVARLQGLENDHQTRIWALVEAWAKDGASDADKAILREKIRVSTLSRRAALRAKKDPSSAALTKAAKAAFVALEPNDLLNRHAWLFREGWVEESADEIEGIEELDFQKRDKRIQDLRIAALREIHEQSGPSGILEMANRGKSSRQIGWLAAGALLSESALNKLLRLAFGKVIGGGDKIYPFESLIAGALLAISYDEARERVLRGVAADLSENFTARLLVMAPFCKSTWNMVDKLDAAVQPIYWNKVAPDWIDHSDAENSEAVERLLKAERPRAAFWCIRFKPENLDTQLLFRLLTDMAQGGKEQPGHYKLAEYEVEKAFKHLHHDATLTLDQKAGLEFAYIEVLARPWDRRACYGIPNLERYIETHPDLFIQAISWVYKRKDGANDPAEFHIPSERIKSMAERGYNLLEALTRIPGHNDLGELEANRLANWIATIRKACVELSRTEVADICIGKVLSHAPVGEDGIWPCEPVREVMEEIESESVMRGVFSGVYNSRGAHWRGEGGDQERELAEKYRKWGQALQLSHPFVASKLLLLLANSYEREANREDTEAGIRRRMP